MVEMTEGTVEVELGDAITGAVETLADNGIKAVEMQGDTANVVIDQGMIQGEVSVPLTGDITDEATADTTDEATADTTDEATADTTDEGFDGYRCTCGKTWPATANGQKPGGHVTGKGSDHRLTHKPGDITDEDTTAEATDEDTTAAEVIEIVEDHPPGAIREEPDKALAATVENSEYRPRDDDSLATQAVKALAFEADLDNTTKTEFFKGAGFGECPHEDCNLAAAGFDRNTCQRHEGTTADTTDDEATDEGTTDDQSRAEYVDDLISQGVNPADAEEAAEARFN